MKPYFAVTAYLCAVMVAQDDGLSLPELSDTAAVPTSTGTATTSTSERCSPDFSGTFKIAKIPAYVDDKSESAKPNPTSLQRRDVPFSSSTSSSSAAAAPLSSCPPFYLNLKAGNLTDQRGWIGSIVANDQYQHDPWPGQKNAKAKSGWAICNNGASQNLQILGSTRFYQCNTQDPLTGRWYGNLYGSTLQQRAEQCAPVTIEIEPCEMGTRDAGGREETASTSRGEQKEPQEQTGPDNEVAGGYTPSGAPSAALSAGPSTSLSAASSAAPSSAALSGTSLEEDGQAEGDEGESQAAEQQAELSSPEKRNLARQKYEVGLQGPFPQKVEENSRADTRRR